MSGEQTRRWVAPGVCIVYSPDGKLCPSQIRITARKRGLLPASIYRTSISIWLMCLGTATRVRISHPAPAACTEARYLSTFNILPCHGMSAAPVC